MPPQPAHAPARRPHCLIPFYIRHHFSAISVRNTASLSAERRTIRRLSRLSKLQHRWDLGPIRSPSGESARHEDAQKRLISATAAAQKRRVGGLAYESPAALRGWRSGEQAGTCSAVLGAAGESRERGRGWPPRAAKAKYRTILRRSERKAVSWLWGGAVLRGPGAPSWTSWPFNRCIGPDGPPVGGVQQLRLPWFSRKIYV